MQRCCGGLELEVILDWIWGGGGDEIVFVTRKGKKKDHGRYEKKKPNNEEIFATYSCSKTIVDVG